MNVSGATGDGVSAVVPVLLLIVLWLIAVAVVAAVVATVVVATVLVVVFVVVASRARARECQTNLLAFRCRSNWNGLL